MRAITGDAIKNISRQVPNLPNAGIIAVQGCRRHASYDRAGRDLGPVASLRSGLGCIRESNASELGQGYLLDSYTYRWPDRCFSCLELCVQR